MFARFEGRKSLKKTKNVDVHDDKVECGHDRDNIKYVEVVDSDDEELVSEEFDGSDKMYDDIGSMHESSGNLHDHGEDSVDGDDPIIIPHLNQQFPNLQAGEICLGRML